MVTYIRENDIQESVIQEKEVVHIKKCLESIFNHQKLDSKSLEILTFVQNSDAIQNRDHLFERLYLDANCT